jgi:hypothetical protein
MEAQTETTQEVPNVFPEHKKKDYAYKTLPKGTRHMGIIAIKAIERTFEGKTSPAYRVTFRDKEQPDSFGNVSFGAATKAGSRCRAFVEECLGETLPGKFADAKLLHRKLTGLVGKWFDVVVKHKPNPKNSSNPFVNLISFEAVPSSIDAVAYFKEIPVTELKADTLVDDEDLDINI